MNLDERAEAMGVAPTSALAKYVEVSKPFDDIFLIVPQTDLDVESPRSPSVQAQLCTEAALGLVDNAGVQTVLYDGTTTTGFGLVEHYARAKSNKNKDSKHFEVEFSEEEEHSAHVTAGVNWLDNGMAQRCMVQQIRQPLMSHPKDFGVILIGHEVSSEGFIGMNAGGPANLRKFPGGAFTNWFYLDIDFDGNRRLLTKTGSVMGNQAMVTMKTRPGTRLDPLFFDEHGIVKIPDLNADPDETLKFMQGMFREIMRATGSAHLRCGLAGPPDAGKSTLMSAYLTLEGKKPAVIIMADNQTNLPTYWPEALGLERDK